MNRTVMVVDDDEDLRNALGDVLREEGYQVVCVADGAEALSWLRGNPEPGIILLDLMMPIMSGWQFREQQRRDPRLAQIRTAVMTAIPNARAAEQLAADYFLPKPVLLAELLEVVERACG